MLRTATGLILLPILFASCSPRSTLEAVEAQLATCEEDLELTRSDAAAWRDRLDSWEHQIDLRLQEQEAATAMSLDTIQLKFSEIRAAVPKTIEAEVGGQIDEVERLLISGFKDLSQGNLALQEQLEDTRRLLSEARTELQAGNQLARSAQSERREIRGQISGLTSETEALVGRIHEFDRTRLQCKQCPEYLDLRKRKVADISEFHNEIVAHLAKLQGNLVAPTTGPTESTSGTEPGS